MEGGPAGGQVRERRIACTGLVSADAGSVASAGFMVLRELLARGYEIDFFGKPSFVFPEALLAYPGFRYVDCSQPAVDRMARANNEYLRWVGRRVANAVNRRRTMRHIRAAHAQRDYDLQLSWGQWAFGRTPGVPVVSVVQGPPGTDSRSVVRHGSQIRQLCGTWEYVRLRLYSVYRASVGRPPFANTDVAVCGSKASEAILVAQYGLLPSAVASLPYPVDLELFQPPADATIARPLELAWIGRVVPRKRLDLFLDAGAQLISEGHDVKLTIVGRFPFATGFRQLIERFPYQERMSYARHAPREEVADLLRRAAVLVQPSEEEDFGSSVAEALACGTPVVVGASNGTGDYIGDGGERCTESSSDAVARAVSRVLQRLEADPRVSQNGARAAATENFHVRHVADGLERIFARVLGEAGRAPRVR
jgi:glycosyltransferase involved in cell wall biosynthesis